MITITELATLLDQPGNWKQITLAAEIGVTDRTIRNWLRDPESIPGKFLKNGKKIRKDEPEKPENKAETKPEISGNEFVDLLLDKIEALTTKCTLLQLENEQLREYAQEKSGNKSGKAETKPETFPERGNNRGIGNSLGISIVDSNNGIHTVNTESKDISARENFLEKEEIRKPETEIYHPRSTSEILDQFSTLVNECTIYPDGKPLSDTPRPLSDTVPGLSDTPTNSRENLGSLNLPGTQKAPTPRKDRKKKEPSDDPTTELVKSAMREYWISYIETKSGSPPFLAALDNTMIQKIARRLIATFIKEGVPGDDPILKQPVWHPSGESFRLADSTSFRDDLIASRAFIAFTQLCKGVNAIKDDPSSSDKTRNYFASVSVKLTLFNSEYDSIYQQIKAFENGKSINGYRHNGANDKNNPVQFSLDIRDTARQAIEMDLRQRGIDPAGFKMPERSSDPG